MVATFFERFKYCCGGCIQVHKKACVDQLSHLDFHIEVAEVMVRANHEVQRVQLGGPTASVPGQI